MKKIIKIARALVRRFIPKWVRIIRENIYKLKIEDQKSELFKYVKLLEIVKPHRSKDIYILNFIDYFLSVGFEVSNMEVKLSYCNFHNCKIKYLETKKVLPLAAPFLIKLF